LLCKEVKWLVLYFFDGRHVNMLSCPFLNSKHGRTSEGQRQMLTTMNTKLDSFLNQIGQMLNHANNNSS
jgi:hypothetical protein